MWKISTFLAFVHTFCLLLATLTALGDKVRYFEGKWNLVKAFWIFTTTLEPVSSAYKQFFSSIFHEKTSKIVMFSDVWKYSDFACFFMKNTWKEMFVSTAYWLQGGCEYPICLYKVSFTFKISYFITKCCQCCQQWAESVYKVKECTYFPHRLP